MDKKKLWFGIGVGAAALVVGIVTLVLCLNLNDDEHHEHTIDFSDTEFHKETCVTNAYYEYKCSCGETITYSTKKYTKDNYFEEKDEEAEEIYKTEFTHDFVNGVCTKCDCEATEFDFDFLSPDSCYVYGYNGDSKDIVIPEEIYGLRVLEIGARNNLHGYYFLNGDYDSLTFGNTIEAVNVYIPNIYSVYDEETDELLTKVGATLKEFIYTGSMQDFCTIDFGSMYSNPLCMAESASIDGEDIKNLVLPKGIDLSEADYTFCGKYIESITLPEDLSTMGLSTFCFGENLEEDDCELKPHLNDFLYYEDGNGYLGTATNKKYMLVSFADENTVRVDDNVKMINGSAWLDCSASKVTIPESVEYFSVIAPDMNYIYSAEEESGNVMTRFSGELVYEGDFKSWSSKKFFSGGVAEDSYVTTGLKWDLGCIICNPVYFANKFSTSDMLLKDYDPKTGIWSSINLVVPDGVETINSYALEGTIFSSVTIPDSLKYVGNYGLGYIYNKDISLNKFNYSGSLKDYMKIEFESYLANPMYNMNYPSMGSLLYIDGNLLTDLKVPSGIKTIGKGQFAGCRSLTSIDFGNTKYIEELAFSCCSNLSAANLKDDSLMMELSGYTEEELATRKVDVNIPATVKDIRMGAFNSHCGNLTVFISKDVEYISTYAFISYREGSWDGYAYPNFIYTDAENADSTGRNNLKWNCVYIEGIHTIKKIVGYSINSDWHSFDAFISDTSLDSIIAKDFVHYTIQDGKLNYCWGMPTHKTIDSTEVYYLADSINVNGTEYKLTELNEQFFGQLSECSTYSIYVPLNVKSISIDMMYAIFEELDFYYEGTEEDWQNMTLELKNNRSVFDTTPVAYNVDISA